MGDRVTLAKKLLDHYRSKAQELLVDYLRDEEVRSATEKYLGQQNPAPARFDEAIEQRPRSPRTHSHQADTSSPPHGASRQRNPNGDHGLHTPSISAGSAKSHVSSLAAAGQERIYLIASDNDDAEWPVVSKSITTKHNLIRDRVVYGRGLHTNIEPVEKLVQVPLPSGGRRWERTTECVRLTWRRRNELTTDVDTFYIVPAKLLDSDVILSSEGWLDHQLPTDIEEAQSPQARYRGRGLGYMEEHDPGIPPHAPTAPMHTYQQPKLSSHVQQVYDRAQVLRDTQRLHVPEQCSPTTQPRPIDHGQPSHAATPLAAKEPSKGQLQVTGMWDKTPIKMCLDMSAPGEDFYQAFHQWASHRKRGGEVQRDRMVLYLRASKNTPEHEAWELSLRESELEDFWESTIDWIQENKNPKAPHLYATVSMESVPDLNVSSQT